MGINKGQQGKGKIEEINNMDYKRVPGSTFEERHKRVTLYLENDLYLLVQGLRVRGEITNLTRFVNRAIMYYLENRK